MENSHYEETVRFVKFKELVMEKLSSVDVNHWCLRNGVEIVQEMSEIAPIEVFFLGLNISPMPDGLSEETIRFVERVGDRVPVSDNEDFAYLFPKELYDKILVFGMLPD